MTKKSGLEEASITIFDRILTGEISAAVVHSDDDVLAFKDIMPQAPIHILVIPKKRARNLSEAAEWSPETLGTFFKKVAQVAQKAGLLTGGYRVVLNTGRDAGQTVDYIHAHILGGEPLGRFGTEL
jgi:histidine triad (HIT) family protein